jgi:hypothetical protein
MSKRTGCLRLCCMGRCGTARLDLPCVSAIEVNECKRVCIALRHPLTSRTCGHKPLSCHVHRMMTDHEVTLVQDSMLEFYVRLHGPKDSE